MLSLLLLGALIAGATLLTVAALWDNIEHWLLNDVANAVEQRFGYTARNNLIKSVSHISRVASKIKNISTVYFKNSSNKYMQAQYLKEFSVSEVDQDVLDELKQKDELLKEMQY